MNTCTFDSGKVAFMMPVYFLMSEETCCSGKGRSSQDLKSRISDESDSARPPRRLIPLMPRSERTLLVSVSATWVARWVSS